MQSCRAPDSNPSPHRKDSPGLEITGLFWCFSPVQMTPLSPLFPLLRFPGRKSAPCRIQRPAGWSNPSSPSPHTWWLLQDNSLSTRTMKLNRPSAGCTLAAGACEDSSAALMKTTHLTITDPGQHQNQLQNRSSQGIKRRLATKTPLSLGTGQGLIRCLGGSWLLGASSAVAGTDEDRSSKAAPAT